MFPFLTRQEERQRIEELRAAIERVRDTARGFPIIGGVYRPVDRFFAWLLPIITFTSAD